MQQPDAQLLLASSCLSNRVHLLAISHSPFSDPVWSPTTPLFKSLTPAHLDGLFFCGHSQGLPGGSVVKNLPPMQEIQEMKLRSLGWEDPLEKEMATHSSILAWEIHGRRRLAGYSPWGRQESDMTEHAHVTWTQSHAPSSGPPFMHFPLLGNLQHTCGILPNLKQPFIHVREFCESEMQTGTADITYLDSTMTRPWLGRLEWLGWLSGSVKEMSRGVFTHWKLPHWKFHSHLMPGLGWLKNATQLGCQQKHLNKYAPCDLGFPQHGSLEAPKVSISVNKKPLPILEHPSQMHFLHMNPLLISPLTKCVYSLSNFHCSFFVFFLKHFSYSTLILQPF